MIKRMVVFASCDVCGLGFRVDVATRHPLPARWDLIDVATDAIQGSLDYQDPWHRFGFSSVQDGKELCHVCTEIYDQAAKDSLLSDDVTIETARQEK